MSRPRASGPAALPQSPFLRELEPYAFAELDIRRRELEASGVRVIDLGMGDPREPTPPAIRQALRDAIPEIAPYPRAVGQPALRAAAAGWVRRRFGVEADPETEILPVNGTKEAIFTLPLAVCDPARRPVVLVPEPGYPIYALGARAARMEVHPVPLRAERGFLLDFEAIPTAVWERSSILWLNYPHNPTGATAPSSFFEEAAERCRRHGVLLVSDEAYVEIYFEAPPPTALAAGAENVLVLHSLSKRSGMAGYRSGFMAGDRRLIGALKKFRPVVGAATPDFVQAAACAAWGDDAHVEAIRGRFRERRDLMVGGLRALGFAAPEVPATFFVWLPLPAGTTAAAFAGQCLEAGIVVLPGTALGPSGEGHVRFSLTAERSELEEALTRLARMAG